MKLKIKKNDTVKVIAGDDKGKVGRVLEVYPKDQRVLVEQVNLHSKHSRPSQTNPKGGIVKKELPLHYSNVMLMDSEKKATRISIRHEDKGNRRVAVRVARTNGKDIQ